MLRLAAASTLVLCLAACGTAPAPVSGAEARHIRSVLADRAWAPVAANYPEALRPEITVHQTVSDRDWPARMVSCLRAVGITAREEGGGVIYSSGGTTSVEFAVYYYSCQAAWPIQSQVSAFLKPRQLQALSSYYRNVVQPCRVVFGRDGTNSPPRFGFAQRMCPSVPSWLNLNGAE
jgi:hypothetical protein